MTKDNEKAAVEKKEKLGMAAYDFIKENATVTGSSASVTKLKWYEFMKQQGVDRKSIDTITDARKEFNNGAVRYAADLAEQAIISAKERGDKPEDMMRIVGKVTTVTPTGLSRATVQGGRTYFQPRLSTPDNKVYKNKFGIPRIRERISKSVTDETVTDVMDKLKTYFE